MQINDNEFLLVLDSDGLALEQYRENLTPDQVLDIVACFDDMDGNIRDIQVIRVDLAVPSKSMDITKEVLAALEMRWQEQRGDNILQFNPNSEHSTLNKQQQGLKT